MDFIPIDIYKSWRCGHFLTLLQQYNKRKENERSVQIEIKEIEISKSHIVLHIQATISCVIVLDMVSYNASTPTNSDLSHFFRCLLSGDKCDIPHTLVHFFDHPLVHMSLIPSGEEDYGLFIVDQCGECMLWHYTSQLSIWQKAASCHCTPASYIVLKFNINQSLRTALWAETSPKSKEISIKHAKLNLCHHHDQLSTTPSTVLDNITNNDNDNSIFNMSSCYVLFSINISQYNLSNNINISHANITSILYMGTFTIARERFIILIYLTNMLILRVKLIQSHHQTCFHLCVSLLQLQLAQLMITLPLSVGTTGEILTMKI
jgi:hypothetical protein